VAFPLTKRQNAFSLPNHPVLNTLSVKSLNGILYRHKIGKQFIPNDLKVASNEYFTHKAHILNTLEKEGGGGPLTTYDF
jgi:hypothetical protein